jgi:hypothetical protein
MSRLGRVLLGILVGAVLTLFVHPYSRPRLFTGALAWGSVPRALAADLASSRDVLPQPKSVSDYSLWMETGAQRIVSRQPTDQREWTNLLRASVRASKLEPDNAYWPQMAAVFLLASQDRLAAQAHWIAASKKARWDDGQTARLTSYRDLLVAAYGPSAWATAAAYPKRSVARARTIELFARDVARTASLIAESGLVLRSATVANGRLMRDGARSMQTLELGIAVVELASYPPNLTSINSPRKLLLARADLYNRLTDAKMTLRAEEADKAFRVNDSWLGFPNSAEAGRDFEEEASLALIAVVLVPACLVATFLGMGLWGVAVALSKSNWGAALLGPPWIIVAGVVLAALTYLLTRSALVAVAVAASAAFLGFGPSRSRSRPSLDLGPLHGFLVGVLGLIILASISGFVAQFSLPGHELVDAIGYPDQALGGPGPILGIGLTGISMLSVIATFYAVFHHISTPTVFLHSLAALGRTMAFGGLILAVVAAPVALLMDRHISREMNQRLTNEPVYYNLS